MSETPQETQLKDARKAYNRIYTGVSPSGWLQFKRGYDAAIEDFRRSSESRERVEKALVKTASEYMAAEEAHTDAMLAGFDESKSPNEVRQIHRLANERLNAAKTALRSALHAASKEGQQ